MNNRALTLSLLMAALAVFFVMSYVSSIEEEASRKFGAEVLVIKAKKDIRELETINETVLSIERIPKRFLEPNAIYFEKKEEDKETTRGLKSMAGTVALVPIKKGEQVTQNKVTEPNMRTGLAPQITPGKRAFAIRIDEISGVSKLVKPGDRVDLIAVLDLGGGKEGKIAKTFLQDVVVLSVGKNVTNNVPRLIEPDLFGGKERIKNLNEDSSFGSITLEVDPNQAQALALVMANSDHALTLSLRNNDDTERVNLGSSLFSDVLGADYSRAPRAPANGRR